MSTPTPISQPLPARASLLGLPTELRLNIPSHCVSLPNLSRAFAIQDQTAKPPPKGHKPQIYTPPILLTCKQLTTEAFHILSQDTLVIIQSPRTFVYMPYHITDFVCKAVLQRVERVMIKGLFENWTDLPILGNLRVVWEERNCLEQVTAMISDEVEPLEFDMGDKQISDVLAEWADWQEENGGINGHRVIQES